MHLEAGQIPKVHHCINVVFDQIVYVKVHPIWGEYYPLDQNLSDWLETTKYQLKAEHCCCGIFDLPYRLGDVLRILKPIHQATSGYTEKISSFNQFSNVSLSEIMPASRNMENNHLTKPLSTWKSSSGTLGILEEKSC